ENGARAALDRIRQEFPDHPAASQAARRLAEIDAADQPAHREITDQEPSRLGRAELALNITTQSMLFAYNICEIAGCDSARTSAATYMLTGGGAFALSLLFTPDGVPTAKAQLIDSAMVWGAWHSALYNSDFFASS